MRFDIFREKTSSQWSKEESPKIRTVFMGTPEIAGSVLRSLVEREYNIVAVFTQPDRPAGRSQEITPSPVKKYALEKNIPVEQPERFDAAATKRLAELKPDLVIVVAYGRILPKEALAIPGFGCINVHASLLPKWRGASPVQNALIAGDTETGITIMLMDEGLDSGPILSQKIVAINPEDDTATLLEKLTREGSALLLETIPLWIRRKIEPKEQDHAAATLCSLIEREDGRIFWNDTARNIRNRSRGLSPWPGVYTFWKKKNGEFTRMKLSKISFLDGDISGTDRKIGEVFESDGKIAVQTGSGIVFIEEVQLAGKDPIPVKSFLNGYRDFLGSTLE